MSKKIVVIGNSEIFHIGSHLFNGAKELGLEAFFCDVKQAFEGPRWLSRVNWHIRGHRPNNLKAFSDKVLKMCRDIHPQWMLATGIAPIDPQTLASIGKLGVERINYLTDDPWNPAHRSKYFFEALSGYDRIFSTRMSNIGDLKDLGCSNVSYLPFGYSPKIHFPEPVPAPERSRFECDVIFVGGADRDRVKYLYRLIESGIKTALYGGYWDRFTETKKYARGYIAPQEMRKAMGAAKIALCLVRRANRDGNAMRTFEIPAMGACMLTEYTAEHERIFGKDGEAVTYFKTIEEMAKKTVILLNNQQERSRLANISRNLILKGGHTYKDRLKAMLKI